MPVKPIDVYWGGALTMRYAYQAVSTDSGEVGKLMGSPKAMGSAEAQLIEANAAAKAATAKIVELSRTVGYTVSETTTAEGITTYVIDTTSGPGEAEFKTIVEGYLEYLAYLEKWNGELPQVVAGEDTLSIIVPNN